MQHLPILVPPGLPHEPADCWWEVEAPSWWCHLFNGWAMPPNSQLLWAWSWRDQITLLLIHYSCGINKSKKVHIHIRTWYNWKQNVHNYKWEWGSTYHWWWWIIMLFTAETVVGKEVNCNCKFMLQTLPVIAIEMCQQLQWVPPEEPIYLIMDNVRGHRMQEARKNTQGDWEIILILFLYNIRLLIRSKCWPGHFDESPVSSWAQSSKQEKRSQWACSNSQWSLGKLTWWYNRKGIFVECRGDNINIEEQRGHHNMATDAAPEWFFFTSTKIMRELGVRPRMSGQNSVQMFSLWLILKLVNDASILALINMVLVFTWV